MPTSSRLSVFCEKIIEAGWLIALIMAPLFFDVYSSRVFEPDKISLVRTLALISLVAWSLRWLDQWRLSTRSLSADEPNLFQRIRTLVMEWHKQNPLTLPTLFIVFVYIASTLASISPFVTFWGSYQRLQGTYSTLSYILIFFLAASLLRTRAQFDRAVNLAITVSVPIALYGIIQHYYLDPLPWGGDVTSRVASNMGNAIFVGAFLILVMPIVIARLIEQVQRAGQDAPSAWQKLSIYLGAVVSVLIVAAAWGFSFDFGARGLLERGGYGGTPTPELLALAVSNFNAALSVSALIVIGWWLLAFVFNRRASTFLLIGLYALIFALQLICIVFTQSRGPQLGILSGLFAFAVLYSIARRAYRLAFASVVVAAFGLAFLVVFNTASAEPIARLRSNQYIGRLGRVFDTNDGTNKVRSLIWEGALQLTMPHPPLWSPTTGDDKLNLIRPLIGYGPEAMYVAYNAFYPPDLAHVESRNASPDRSHNETFDALVMTGLLGFASYIVLFLAIFYYSLKWLGFIHNPLERNLFVGLCLAGAFLTALVFGLVIGWNFIGVALPAGMMVGFLLYLTGFALVRGRHLVMGDPRRTLWLIALLSVVVAHFIEINFGIAIASTRTYFWFIAAMLVAVGTNRVAGLGTPSREMASERPVNAANPTTVSAPTAATDKTRTGIPSRARRTTRRTEALRRANDSTKTKANEVSSTPIVTWAFICGLVLATMGFDYISTTYAGQGNPLNAFVTALTQRPTTQGLAPSHAMLWLFIVTIGAAAAIGLGEWARDVRLTMKDWAVALALFLVLSLAIFSSFVLYHMLLITDLTRSLQGVLATIGMFNFFMVIMIVVIATAMLFDLTLPRLWVGRPWNWLFTPIFAVVAALFIWVTNVEIINADIIYKTAQNSDALGQWDNSITQYGMALQKQRTQDFYMLFLGRAYLESSKNLQDPVAREQRLAHAEKILLDAQEINPLNTDHTANLARLHRAWMQFARDAAQREEHFQTSNRYYAEATRLSPNTAHLYNEWGELFLSHGDRDAALAKFQKSLDLDKEFIQTRLFLAEWYRNAGDTKNAADQYIAALQLDPNALATPDGYPLVENIDILIRGGQADAAGGLWLKAIQRDPKALNPHMELVELNRKLGALNQARTILEEAIKLEPKNISVLTYAANLYSELGEFPHALELASAARNLIPKERTEDTNRYEAFINQLKQLQDALNAIAKNPNDLEAHRRAGFFYFIRTEYDKSLREYQKVIELKADDYDGWRSLALVQIQLNQLAPARASLDQAVALAQPGDKEILQQIQALVEAASREDKAAALALANDLLAKLAFSDQLARTALTTLAASLQK